MRRCLLLAGLLALSTSAWAQSTTYKLDPNHTNVLASWNHLGFSTPSLNFGQADGTLVYDAKDVTRSSVHVRLPIAGIDAMAADFLDHLSAENWFDAAKYPNAHFVSTGVEDLGNGRLRVTGDLTIKDITKPVVLEVQLNGMGIHPMSKKQAIGFNATTTIKRSEFGLSGALPAVSDEVQVRITTEAQEKTPSTSAD